LADAFDREKRSGQRLRRTLPGRQEFRGAGDVEGSEILAAETEASRVGDRKPDLAVGVSVRPIADNAAAGEERGPQATVGVDAGPVRPLACGRVIGEDAPIRDGAIVEVEIEGPGQIAACVREIEGPPVRRESDTVADDYVVDDFRGRSVRVDAVKAAVRPVEFIVHRADPQPPAWIDPAVIQAVVEAAFHRREMRGRDGFGIEQVQFEIDGDQTPGRPRHRLRAQIRAGHVDHPMFARGRIEPLQLRQLDVDPPELLRLLGPERRLAELIAALDDTFHLGWPYEGVHAAASKWPAMEARSGAIPVNSSKARTAWHTAIPVPASVRQPTARAR